MTTTITAIASLMALSASAEHLSRKDLYDLFQSMPIVLYGSEDCRSNYMTSDNIVLTDYYTYLD